MSKGTILWTDAGNLTYIKGQDPVDIEPILVSAINEGVPFVYLESDGMPPNSLCVDPKAVTALVRSTLS